MQWVKEHPRRIGYLDVLRTLGSVLGYFDPRLDRGPLHTLENLSVGASQAADLRPVT